MRMDTENKMTALLWLKEANVDEISKVLKKYGEEKYANKIAIQIKESIKSKKLKTTLDLSKTISGCYPKNKSRKSTYTYKYYDFNNGDMISVTCYDYSKEHGSQDHLNVNLQTKEFGDWLSYEAYK